MFCVLKTLLCGLWWNVYIFYNMASENASALKSWEIKNVIFLHKTSTAMFYRDIIKHFGTNFVILNIFWKQKIVKTFWPVCVKSSVLGGYHFLWNRGVINIRKYPDTIFATTLSARRNFYDPPYPGANNFVTPLENKNKLQWLIFVCFQNIWHGHPGLATVLVVFFLLFLYWSARGW